jgi:hypothetical protein
VAPGALPLRANMTGKRRAGRRCTQRREGGDDRPAAGAFAGFVAGAAAAGRLLGRGRGSWWRLAGLLAGSGLLLAGIGAVLQVAGSGANAHRVAAIAALGPAMGVQGGWAQAHSAPDLLTVVVTSTLVGLAFQTRLGSRESTRWPRRATVV